MSDARPSDDLSHLAAADIDALPFGYIALAPDGTVRKYNRYEADLARKNPADVLGRNFFREVAPCTQVQEFEGRFRRFAAGGVDATGADATGVDATGPDATGPDAGAPVFEPTLTFDFEFAFRHGRQRVRIGFVRSPLPNEVIVTVNRVRQLDLATSADLRRDSTRGLLFDDGGRPAVVANGDFFTALDRLYAGHPEGERRDTLHRLGKEWGVQHALRVESFVQREHGVTLREVELQVALETLSGSLGTLGLGRFDVDLRYRQRGLLLAVHRDSPFDLLFAERDGATNDLLAGLHAGFLSYLSGRSLAGRELARSRRPGQPTWIAIGTAARLERLFDPVEGSPDADLLVALGVRPAVPLAMAAPEAGRD